MNTRHTDILNAISRMTWLSTTGVAEAIEPLGYGGGKSWNEYRDMISKDLGYLKSKGLITGEDRPQLKGKPVRYWSLANPQSECQSAEMASDVAELQPTIKESLAVAETTTPEPVSVAVKIEQKMPITVHQAMVATWNESLEPEDVLAFMRGIEFAEKHHGIGQ